MRSRKLLLLFFVLVLGGLVGIAEVPQQQAQNQQGTQVIGNPKKMCGWPRPPVCPRPSTRTRVPPARRCRSARRLRRTARR